MISWIMVAAIVVTVLVNSYFWYLKGYKDGILKREDD